MRDKQLFEAKVKKNEATYNAAKEEQAQVEKLQKQIHDEQVAKMNRKNAERQAAQKVIKENEAEKAKRLDAINQEKQQTAELLQMEMRAMEAKEKKRLQDVKNRSEKI